MMDTNVSRHQGGRVEAACQWTKEELNRYAHLSNKEWGHLIGGFLGFGLGCKIVDIGANSSYAWPIAGPVTLDSSFSNKLIVSCIPALSGGFFSNLFSNFGASIDVVTRNKTLLSFVVDTVIAARATQHNTANQPESES